MMNALVIAKKEFKAYFTSIIAYIFITLFLGISAWLYTMRLFSTSGSADMREYFMNLTMLYLFFIPALSMRLWAEEKNTGTIELLMSFPVRTIDLVIGKFAAALAFLTVTLALTFSIPLTVSSLGDLDWGVVMGGYLGLALLGASYIALGGFISSLTKNQIVAFLLTLVACFMFYIAGQQFFLRSLPGFMIRVVEIIGLGNHYDSIARGMIDTRDIVYYMSFIAFMLFLNSAVIENQRWRHKLSSSAMAAVLLAVLVAGNILSLDLYARFDLTEEKILSISDSTKKVLSKLDDILSVKVYCSSNFPEEAGILKREVEDKLKEYRAYSGNKIQIEWIDPLVDDETEKKAQELGIEPMNAQMREKAESKALRIYLGLAMFYNGKKEVFPSVTRAENLEYDFTRAIIKLMTDEEVRVGFLSGHSEPEIGDAYAPLAELMKKQAEVVPVTITPGQPIGKDISVLVVASPRTISPAEKFALDQYIMSGGKAIFLIDSVQLVNIPNSVSMGIDAQHNLFDLMMHYGVRLDKNLLQDFKTYADIPRNPIFTAPYPFWVAPMKASLDRESPVTNRFEQLIFPWVSSIEVMKDRVVGKKVVELVKSSDLCYAATNQPGKNGIDISIESIVKKDPSELKQYLIGAAVTGEFESFYASRPLPEIEKKEGDPNPPAQIDPATVIKKSPETTIIVFGDSDFIDSKKLNWRVTQPLWAGFFSNNYLMMNMVDWLTIGDELIGIRSRELNRRSLEKIEESSQMILRVLNIAGVPLLAIIFGLSLYFIRRSRRSHHESTKS